MERKSEDNTVDPNRGKQREITESGERKEKSEQFSQNREMENLRLSLSRVSKICVGEAAR